MPFLIFRYKFKNSKTPSSTYLNDPVNIENKVFKVRNNLYVDFVYLKKT